MAQHSLRTCSRARFSGVVFLVVGALLFLGHPNASFAAASATEEVRAIWVTRWDFKSAEDVRRTVRWSAAVGFNRILFQVRGRADAFYRSRYEPWGEELGGRDPGFDPLSVAIEEGRRVGVPIHAWVNVLPAWKGSSAPRDSRHVYYRHPEWFLEDSRGKRHMRDAADYTILNPCLPEVRAYLTAVITDIVRRYAVAGLHLDYVRFIGRDSRKSGDVPFDPRSLSLFRDFAGGSPATKPAEWDRWRGLSLDTLVWRIATEAKKARPGCIVSVAAIADLERARTHLFQDVAKWQTRAWVDEIFPMTYTKDDGDFARQVSEFTKKLPSAAIVGGIGAYRHSGPADTVRQIQVARALGTRGYCVFAFTNFFPSPSHEAPTDEAGKRLRVSMRNAILAVNRRGIPEAAPRSGSGAGSTLANPPNRPKSPTGARRPIATASR